MGKIGFIIAKAMKKILNPPALHDCVIDRTSRVCSRSELTKTNVGRYSYIGYGCFAVNADIGSFCSIADNCRIGGAAHPTDRVSSSPVFHSGTNVMKKNFASFPRPETPRTVIENDVWLGAGCMVKSGVTVHNGAVIGMGSVVTHDVGAYEIWAGNPARKIRDRYPTDPGGKSISSELEKTEWWNMSDEMLSGLADTFDDPEKLIKAVTEKK